MRDRNDLKSLSQERFGKFHKGYVKSKIHAKGAELERLVEIAQPQPDWTVLDIATGGGHTALKFAPFVAQVIATDITPKMLESAHAFITSQGVKNVTTKFADAESLPFDKETFELVTCRIAPHHFPDCLSFIHEGRRVLKPGGLLLVQDHVLPEDEQAARYIDAFERLRDTSHNRAYSISEWIVMFQEAGLEVEHTEQIIKRHEFLSWAERQGCKPETIEQLVDMVKRAPEAATDWMEPKDFGTPEATFANRHIIIAGRKGGKDLK
jgi:ubiquinone/menaquinone biosynthesis C-methylase UbiE